VVLHCGGVGWQGRVPEMPQISGFS
jgi:hypothetical protein